MTSVKDRIAEIERKESDLPPMMEGFLTKRGQFIKNWKVRWFVLLSNGQMQYFTDQLKQEQKGVFELTHESIVELAPDLGACKHVLSLWSKHVLAGGSNIIMFADSENTRSAWYGAIQAAIEHLKENQGIVGTVGNMEIRATPSKIEQDFEAKISRLQRQYLQEVQTVTTSLESKHASELAAQTEELMRQTKRMQELESLLAEARQQSLVDVASLAAANAAGLQERHMQELKRQLEEQASVLTSELRAEHEKKLEESTAQLRQQCAALEADKSTSNTTSEAALRAQVESLTSQLEAMEKNHLSNIAKAEKALQDELATRISKVEAEAAEKLRKQSRQMDDELYNAKKELRAELLQEQSSAAERLAARTASEVALREQVTLLSKRLETEAAEKEAIKASAEIALRDQLAALASKLESDYAIKHSRALEDAMYTAKNELRAAVQQEQNSAAEKLTARAEAEALLREQIVVLTSKLDIEIADKASSRSAAEARLRDEVGKLEAEKSSMKMAFEERLKDQLANLTKKLTDEAAEKLAAQMALESTLRGQLSVITSKLEAEVAEKQANKTIADALLKDQLAALTSKLESESVEKLRTQRRAMEEELLSSKRELREELQREQAAALAKQLEACNEAQAKALAAQVRIKDEECVLKLQQLEASFKVQLDAAAHDKQMLEVVRRDSQLMLEDANALTEKCMADYLKERKLRKVLHNKLQDVLGNIRVICRVRPVQEAERKVHGQDVDVTDIPNDDTLYVQRDAQTNTKYEYDRVFGQSSTQEEVFEAVQPLIVSVLDGYNVCIFAYGQTGSGKTYTMEGYGGYLGVSPRAIRELLSIVDSMSNVVEYTLTLSMLEIYNETIRDLLEPATNQTSPKDKAPMDKTGSSDKDKDKDKLEIRQDKDGHNIVVGLTEVDIFDFEQVQGLLRMGNANRAVGSHDMNEHSSRSHSIITVVCRGKNKADGGGRSYGKLHLIDLAGSERASKTDATGDRLRESQSINKSLSALGDVIYALGNKKATHVPYRNSKLTFLLQDSLGGTSKVLSFVNISPAVYNVSETVCSLNFATRCRSTELGEAKRQSVSGGGGGGGSGGSSLSPSRPASAARDDSGSISPRDDSSASRGTPSSGGRLSRRASAQSMTVSPKRNPNY